MGNKKVIILRDPDFTGMGYTKEEVKNYQQIFDLILSTFKFIQ
jgi:5S rRNA maturation endonuclease (ribonuclease M5)